MPKAVKCHRVAVAMFAMTMVAAGCSGSDGGLTQSDDTVTSSPDTTQPTNTEAVTDTTEASPATTDTTVSADTTEAPAPSPSGARIVGTIPIDETSATTVLETGDAIWLGGNYEEVVHVDLLSGTSESFGGLQGIPALVGGQVWVFGESISVATDAGLEPRFENTVAAGHVLSVGDAIWATDGWEGVTLHAPTVGAFAAELSVAESGPGALVDWNGALWIAMERSGQLARLDPSRFEVVESIPLGGTPTSLVRYGPYLWAGLDEGAVIRFDPATGAQQRVELGVHPGEVVTHAGALWYPDTTDDSGEGSGFARLDAATLEVKVLKTGDSPVHVFADGPSMWVSNEYDHTLTEIDARTGEPLGELEVDGSPTVFAAAGPGRLAVVTWRENDSVLTLFEPGPPRDAAALTVKVNGAGAELSGPVASPDLIQAVQAAVTETTGAAPADQTTAGAAAGVPGTVRVVGDGSLAQGDLAARLEGVASRLEAAGVYVDRDYLAVPPPSVTSVEAMLNALFANSSVFFDSGSAELNDESLETLSLAAEILNRVPFVAVEIEGHTDSDGDAASNQVLSEQRAEAVREYLVGYFGGDDGRLTAVGYGEDRPIADNETPDGKARNRRIQFRITGTAANPTG